MTNISLPVTSKLFEAEQSVVVLSCLNFTLRPARIWAAAIRVEAIHAAAARGKHI